MQEISLSRLRQHPPEPYQLGPDDVLGIFIEGVLDAGEVRFDATGVPGRNLRAGIPYEFPEDPTLPPFVGIPVPVREDGQISLPLNVLIDVEGLTIAQVEELIRKAYTIDRRILKEGADTIVVTLQKRRTHRVLVVREEEGATSTLNKDAEVIKRGAGYTLDLPQGENDLMTALSETGGLPGLDAKNEVLIIRSNGVDGREWDHIVAQIKSTRCPCTCPPLVPDAPNVVRIPLRFFPDNVPKFSEQDVILGDGDIVVIESREREKFYTGGVLGGGEYPIPRDYDLDIMGAIAIAGGPVGSSGAVLSAVGQGGGGQAFGQGGGGGSKGPLPPTDALVIRKLCDGSQIPIRIDLKRAIVDPSQRILIQPEDVVILRYKCAEEVVNAAFNLIQFNFLFNNFGSFN
jgi:hypothetical protein